MQLFLYNLDAPKDAEPLCKLKVGEYNVGRGQMLKVNVYISNTKIFSNIK